jgi:hypothetical protein
MPELAPDGSWFPILDRVSSFEELHVLLSLADAAPRVWSIGELSARHPTIEVPDAVDQLVGHGLAVQDPRGISLTSDPILGKACHALVVQYRSNPLEILHTLTERALSRVRSAAARMFADAFVVRWPDAEEE